MFFTIEQFSATSKANGEARLVMFNTLTRTAFDSLTKLVELNLSVVKASLTESAVVTQQLAAAGDPQKFCSLMAAHARPPGEQALSYVSHLTSIGSATQAEFGEAIQAAITETHHNRVALAEAVFKKAPAVALVKSALGSASAGGALFTKGMQHAVEVLGEHLASAANQASQAEQTTTKSAARK